VTEPPALQILAPHEREAVRAFLRRLRQQFGDRILHVWFYGSKARGNADEESDLDLLVVVQDGNEPLEEAIGHLALTLSLEYGVLLGDHTIGQRRFAQMRARQELFYRNLIQEGTDLWVWERGCLPVAEAPEPYDTGTLQDYLRHRLERSREDMAWAWGALERGEYRLALNRAYYAVFHLTSAVLLSLNVTRRRHSGVESAFHEHLVKPGRIEAEYANAYATIRRWRERADYAFDVEFTAEQTRPIIEQADRLVARLERFLRESSP